MNFTTVLILNDGVIVSFHFHIFDLYECVTFIATAQST